MISALIKFGKKILLSLIVVAMLLSGNIITSYADYSENSTRPVDIVIRAGEWANENQAKPGKRYVWGTDINISRHGLSAKDIPSDIPLRIENNEWFISEADINLKLARAIATKLDRYYGINVNLQYATEANSDLNNAGRIADKCDPKIYLSVHHNSYKDDTTGYFFMVNQGDINSSKVARKISESIADNGMIPQRDNRENDGYIGELNTVKKDDRICILGEFGYFNKAELMKIISNEYVDYISNKVAESLYNQLKNMTKDIETVIVKESQPKTTGIKNTNREDTSVIISFTEEGFNVTNLHVEETEVVQLSFK